MFSLIKKHFTCPEIDRFEGVDFETFIGLESDAIKEVIPEVIPRLNFNTQYKNYLRTIDLQTISESEIISNLIIVDSTNNDTALNNVHSMSLECVNDQPPIGVLLSNEVNLLPGESSSDVQSRESFNQMLSPVVRSITSPQDIINIPSIELKIIIKQYSQKCLDNSDRILVGKEIIRHLLFPNPERVIMKEEFQQIARNIVKLFPKEVPGCYYTASRGSAQAHGKLYTAYSKLKARLRDAGLIGKRPKSKTVKEAEKELNNPGQSEDTLQIVMKIDDFDRVKHYWIMSHKYRSAELIPKLKTLDYINMFPAFKQPKGYDLLCIDASLKFPSIASTLLDISKKILIFASRLENRLLDVKILLKEFNEFEKRSTVDAVLKIQQQLIALRLIPHLLKENCKRKGKTDATLSFFTSYKSIAKADQNDVNTAHALPYLHVIGDSDVPEAELVICGTKFVIEDPITGFDVLFKSFLALSLNYPDESQHLWLFVQKCIYNIHQDTDAKLPNVTKFINDILNASGG